MIYKSNINYRKEKLQDLLKSILKHEDKIISSLYEDFKKPIFSQTTKFKKNPNFYKNYKYVKIDRDKKEEENKFIFEDPIHEDDKISILIKSYLNKISDENYNIISQEFIDELLNLDYDESIFACINMYLCI